MGRLFVYDENMTDERAKITVEKMAAVADITAPEKAYITATGDKTLSVTGGCIIGVGGSIFQTAETELTVANLDEASDFTHGHDYYIYICDPGDDSQDEIYMISENSTWPNGDEWDMDNTRKIGGFHYGRVRNVNEYGQEVNAAGAVRGSGWESNTKVAIIPNSVWTTAHRPKCDPAGMVYLGNALWGDIYIASSDGGQGLQSAYNAMPITGTEGLNWYIANEKAARVGKRLPSYAEWLVGAEGSPQGLDGSNANGHTATTNKARAAVGMIANAVSVKNVCDAVGDVWKWLDEFCLDPTATAWAWHNVIPGYGQIYMPSATALRAFIAGGFWNGGVRCGSRTVGCGYCPWGVGTYVGVWCVCDSL